MLANVTIEFVLWHHIDLAMNQEGPCFGKGDALVKQVAAVWEVHIAVSPFLAPHHRAEHPYAASTLPAVQCVYGFAFRVQMIKLHVMIS